MYDLEPVDSRDVSSAGVRGIGASVVGVGLLVVQGIAGAAGGIVGLVVGGVLMFFGASNLKSDSSTDRRGGGLTMAAGAILALPGIAHLLGWLPVAGGLLRFVSGLSGFVVGAGALGLIGYGVFNLVKFAKGLRSRR